MSGSIAGGDYETGLTLRQLEARLRRGSRAGPREADGLEASERRRRRDVVDFDPLAIVTVGAGLGFRVGLAIGVQAEDGRLGRPELAGSVIEVADFCAQLADRGTASALGSYRVHGGLFPSLLLYQGWWAQASGGAAAWGPPQMGGSADDDVRNIQSWLNQGFEQWGPSWDLGSEEGACDLFAQLGYGDEANSIPVVIGRRKAFAVREALADRLVVPATVTGTLCNRNQVATLFGGQSRGIAEMLMGAQPLFEHFLLVDDENPDHGVEPAPAETLPLYSAYLWQCLIRRTDEAKAREGALTMSDAIFLWEHSNLTDRSSVAFNFDSLMHKRAYLEGKLGAPLSVLHSSYRLGHFLPGIGDPVPIVPSATMRALFANLRDRLSRG